MSALVNTVPIGGFICGSRLSYDESDTIEFKEDVPYNKQYWDKLWKCVTGIGS
jgi:hypothetical protein